ncbi:MAG: cell division protein FtsL [Pseudomonadota bacterium]
MNRHGVILLLLAIIAIAGWAYSINYNTLTTLDRVSELRSEIATERETLQVLKVEWAYLNAPERLEKLVRRHNRALGLMPMTPEVLSHAAAVPFAEGQPQFVFSGIPGDPYIPVPRGRPAWRSNQ